MSEKLLRFDFSHFTKATDDQLRQIERLVNEKIRQQIPLVERRTVPIAEATTLGAMALFGEKYGEFVRVITFDKEYSVELCGGLHVPTRAVSATSKSRLRVPWARACAASKP